MNKNPKRELLDDILRDEADNLRQELFEASLIELRQRKQQPATRSSFPWAIAAGLALGAGLFFFTLSHRIGGGGGVREANVPRTHPVTAIAGLEIVSTGPLKMEIVDNQKYRPVIVENSSTLNPVELLGDAALLALF